MIKIESIEISEFRGIRHLTLDFRGKNFAICGPNGTGKSGVVDALEFVLTGNISRLSGEGRGEISLSMHGPHVDKRNDPDKARVTATIAFPTLKKTATIERSLKNPRATKVTPPDPTILQLLETIGEHPEVVLSRRELIRYVLAPPGERSKEVEALLNLGNVEQVRVGLQKIANNCEKQIAPIVTAVADAREGLLRALGITELTANQVLASTNAQRGTLGLPPLEELTETTSLRDGIAATGTMRPQRVPKLQALDDIRAARKAVAEIVSSDTATRVSELTSDLSALAGDPLAVAGVQQQRFYTVGMGLIEGAACPFCDTAWDPIALRKQVQAKIDHLKELSDRLAAIETKVAPLIATMKRAQTGINSLTAYAMMMSPQVSFQAGREFSAACAATIVRLGSLLPIAETITVLNALPIVPQVVIDVIAELEKALTALPDPTKQDAARDWLTVAQERLEVYRTAKRKQKTAEEQAKKARLVSDTYAKTSDIVLTAIYTAVESDFSSLYRLANRDDEGNFEAHLIPSMGKLGFDVDFYGRGFFPPGAYHSEGHQDSMGLCLYLALMRHLLGGGFTFAVLDDVLMSIDAGHRREVCTLLKAEFPDTQFIMTTHDPIWLRHMKIEKLIESRSSVQFRCWDVDRGPSQWDDRDVWTEISEDLDTNEVRAAAGLLRHYLEHVSAELCHRLRAPVEYRGDAKYQLGELLPEAIGQMRRLYKKGKDAASSWGQKEILQLLTDRECEFAKCAEASCAEQWQVNVAIHYNSWGNLGSNDFKPVVKSYMDLLQAFGCPGCGEYLRVSPDRETVEVLRCECGATNINLKKKGT
jgi:energy-coupling factor transporter ATP-binding protein EcfA2